MIEKDEHWPRMPSTRGLLLFGVALSCLCGCMTPRQSSPVMTRMDGLQSSVDRLQIQLAQAQAASQARESETSVNVATLNARILQLQTEMEALPGQVSELCQAPADPAVTQCDEEAMRTVEVSGDKLVVGELERIWIDPPQAVLEARIDTGASSSSLHSENLVEFERDGEDWVRFDIRLDEDMVTLEREILRYVRVYQQADPEGSRRPVVSLRVRLGNLNQVVDFTLADRSHLDYELILGRNFLTDVALVDVGKQYIQPVFQPQQKN
jgi:hypothetical protein